MAEQQTRAAPAPPVRLEILAYAPTEFFHCQHCEVVWNQVGLGPRIRRDQRASQLPPDLQAEYEAISDWVMDAHERYGDRLSVSVVDAASFEGVLKSLRHRARRFPAFILDGRERLRGFDRGRLDAALAQRLGPGARAPRGKGGEEEPEAAVSR